MALGRKLVQNTHYEVKGSSTSLIKLKTIQSTGMKAFRVDLQDHLPDDFFRCDVLISTVPPSVGSFEQKMIKLIQLLRQYSIQKIVFISTTSVYPNLNREVIEADADYIKSPHSGVTMLAIEDLFRGSSEFQTTILRFAGLYGPGREPARFLAGKSDVKGADNPVNLIHQDDCVAIIARIIEKGVWGETFNACADEHPTRKVFYEKAAKTLGVAPPSFSEEAGLYKIVNSEKLKEMLPYTFIFPRPIYGS